MVTLSKSIIGTLILTALLLGAGCLYLQPENTLMNNYSGQSQAKSIADETVYTIIAFGDSLTAGYGLPVAESYPALLQKSLTDSGFTVKVINAGVSGETSRGNLERAEFIAKQKPDMILLGIGGNDALRALPVTATKTNIVDTIKILEKSESSPVIILLAMQAPLNAGFAYKRSFDAIYKEIAKSESVQVVPFITTEVFLNSEYVLPDRVHLNKAGYQKVIDDYLLDVITKKLKK